MRFFEKDELRAVIMILAVIVTASLFNFNISIRRARDAQRQSDVNAITDALNKFNRDFGTFPPSSPDGRIIACEKSKDQITVDINSEEFKKLDTYGKLLLIGRPCDWGKDPLRDFADLTYPSYMNTIPVDPLSSKRFSYFYISNSKQFQLFAHLEASDEPGYDQRIIMRKLRCGNQICNFGRSSFNIPLEITIEEYEQRIKQEEKK